MTLSDARDADLHTIKFSVTERHARGFVFKKPYVIWVKLRDAKISLSVTRDAKPTKGDKVSLSKKPVIQEGAEAECFPSAPSVGRAGPAGRNSTFGGRRLTKVLLRYFRRK